MMKELGRELYSGTLTKRLALQGMQDKPLPAEDVITVENLLTVASAGMFRGPSLKLLSYDVLMGDAYALPSTLKPYGEYLLSKVCHFRCVAASRIHNKLSGLYGQICLWSLWGPGICDSLRQIALIGSVLQRSRNLLLLPIMSSDYLLLAAQDK
jgi:hypothetical protein